MKASFNWLRTLVPALPNSPREVAARLTSAGLEVEAEHVFGAGTESCLVVEVRAVRPHPSKSGLRLVTVNRGAGAEPLEIVCGAPNVPEPGGLVVLAPLGSHLPAAGMTIERRAIAGVQSEGMLCSEQELGLSEESAGILVLAPAFAKPGTPLVQAEPAFRDVIFEIGLTPNRPDGLGHLGLAREAAALFGLPSPTVAKVAIQNAGAKEQIRIEIQDADGCPHYGAAILTGAKIKSSPLWIRYRLLSLDVRPISSVVDVTNWVMFEFGHPMHAFDLEKIRGGKIVVRRARSGERLRTLDGVDRTLSEDDLVIADGASGAGGERGLALAGVMGGETSEISASTQKILLECAYFDPRSIRRSSRRHGLHTESSHRFERGIDYSDTMAAIARAAELIAQLTGAKAAGDAQRIVAKEIPTRSVVLRPSRQAAVLGTVIDRKTSTDTLARLGFTLTKSETDADTFSVPTHRPDVEREVDLIEEVIRVHGFDHVPTVLPKARPTREHGHREELSARFRRAAVELGLSEAITHAFVSEQALASVGAPKPGVKLANPIHENQTVMRTSLLPGLLDALLHARRHAERDVRLFSVGSVFLAKPGAKLPEERTAFAALLAGDRAMYLSSPEAVDPFDAKAIASGLVERVVRRQAVVRSFEKTAYPPHLHPRAAGEIWVEGQRVGQMGLLHPNLLDELDTAGPVAVVEIDGEGVNALGIRATSYAAIPRFPAMTRDIALVVHQSIAAGDVGQAVREAAGPLAEEVVLFDRFVGQGIAPEHASLAFHVVYRADDRTLTDADVDKEHANVLKTVGARFGATLRA